MNYMDILGELTGPDELTHKKINKKKEKKEIPNYYFIN